MPQQFSQERRALLITIAVFVLLAGGLGAAVFYAYKTQGEMRVKIGKAQKDINQFQKRIAQREELEAEWVKRRNESAEILNKLPSGHQIEKLVKQLNQVGVEAGVVWHALKRERVPRAVSARRRGQAATAAGPSYDKYIYSIKLGGKYEQFVDFIYKVEWQMPRFVQVEALDIKAYEDGLVPGTTKHEFDVTLVTYTYAGSDADLDVEKPQGGGN